MPKPKPEKPRPVCAGQNCGGNITSSSQSLDEITCPCGYGYYDKKQHKFIPGWLVRNGKAPSREAYVDHVRRCPDREDGAPILGVVHEGTTGTKILGTAYLGATGSQAQVTSARRHTREFSEHSDGEGHNQAQVRRPVTGAPERSSMFFSKADFEAEPLAFYFRLFNKARGTNLGLRKDPSDKGWVLLGDPESLPKAAVDDIKRDSAKWRREAIETKSSGITYTESRTATERQKCGVCSDSDDDSDRRTSRGREEPRSLDRHRKNDEDGQYRSSTHSFDALPQRAKGHSYQDSSSKPSWNEESEQTHGKRRGNDEFHRSGNAASMNAVDQELTYKKTPAPRPRHDSGLSMSPPSSVRPSKTTASSRDEESGRGYKQSPRGSNRYDQY